MTIRNEYLIDDKVIATIDNNSKQKSITTQTTFNQIIKEYDPRFINEIINHCTYGGSVESFSGEKGIDPDALTRWTEDYEDFKAAVKVAISAEYRYWEKELHFALTSKDNDFRLASINRKLGEIGKLLLANGLRSSLYKNLTGESEDHEVDQQFIEDEDFRNKFTRI